MTPTSLIRCEINAAATGEGTALAGIARTCARDLAQPINIKIIPHLDAPPESLITLCLPAELAASQHPVWCLACRLACFCPDARVSVLVLGTDAFKAASAPLADDFPARQTA